MKILKWIPNILTLLRMILTVIYLVLLSNLNLNLNSHNRVYFTFTIIIFSLICITDLTDGKIARKVGAVSRLGAVLDVAADLVFILSSTVVLFIKNMIPAWVIPMIMTNFTVFLVTSFIMRNSKKNSGTFFIFDHFGRIAAVNFFLIPAMVSFVYIGLDVMYINIFIYITLILVLLSSAARCINCYRTFKLKVKLDSCNSMASE